MRRWLPSKTVKEGSYCVLYDCAAALSFVPKFPEVSLPASRWYTRMLVVCQLEPVSIVRKMPSIPDAPVVSHGPSSSSGLVLGICVCSWPVQGNGLIEIRHTR